MRGLNILPETGNETFRPRLASGDLALGTRDNGPERPGPVPGQT